MKQRPGQYIDGVVIARDPGHYILCFSFFGMKNLLDRKSQDETYIDSSCEAFSVEMEFDFKRFANWLKYFNLNMKSFGLYADGEPGMVCREVGEHAVRA